MKEHKPELLKGAAVALGVVTLFIVVSVAAHQYEQAIGSVIREAGAAGPIVFTLLTAACLVLLVPLDVSVLIPLAIAAWGSLATAALSVTGWTIGSAISFHLARRYGRPFVERIIGAERIGAVETRTPRQHLFWWVVGMQALIQVDFISYMFGLFTEMSLKRYALATTIGNLVPGFFFAYVGDLPIWYEIVAVAAGLAVSALLFWRFITRVR